MPKTRTGYPLIDEILESIAPPEQVVLSDEQEAREREANNDAATEHASSHSIPCSKCGKPTTWDTTYGNLCYRCVRADNE